MHCDGGILVVKRIVATGGRLFTDIAVVAQVLNLIQPDEVFVGDCPTGADKLVRQWCAAWGIECRVFEAHWDKEGRAAGPNRNRRMVDAAGPKAIVVAFPGGSGTFNCREYARVKKKMTVLNVQR